MGKSKRILNKARKEYFKNLEAKLTNKQDNHDIEIYDEYIRFVCRELYTV